MTAMEIYWIMQADNIVNCALVACSILSMVVLAQIVVGMMDEFSINVKMGLGATVPIWLLCMFLVAFMPSTKTLCAMYVVPQIVSEENIDTVSGDMAEIYELGIERLKDAIGEEREETNQ